MEHVGTSLSADGLGLGHLLVALNLILVCTWRDDATASRLVESPCVAALTNPAYDQWDGDGLAFAKYDPDNDTFDPRQGLPVRSVDDLDEALRRAHARATHFEVKFDYENSKRRIRGRVSSTHPRVVILTSEGEAVVVDPKKIVLESYTVLPSKLVRPTEGIASATPVSDIAARMGINYVIHGARFDKALQILKHGQLDATTCPSSGYCRPAVYLEVRGAAHEGGQILNPGTFRFVFDPRVLDRTDYFFTPSWNYGARSPFSVDAVEKVKLAEIFWDIARGFDGRSNEVVIREPVSLRHLRYVMIAPGAKNDVLAGFARGGVAPPPGSSWDRLVIESDVWPAPRFTGEGPFTDASRPVLARPTRVQSTDSQTTDRITSRVPPTTRPTSGEFRFGQRFDFSKVLAEGSARRDFAISTLNGLFGAERDREQRVTFVLADGARITGRVEGVDAGSGMISVSRLDETGTSREFEVLDPYSINVERTKAAAYQK